MKPKNNLGNRLEAIIKVLEKGNKSNFSVKTGKNPAQITRMCQGKSNPTSEFLLILSQMYQINIHWLLTGEGNMQTIITAQEEKENPTQFGKPIANSSSEGTTSFYIDKREEVTQAQFMEWEKEGRLIVFSTFPSIVYRNPRTKEEIERNKTIRNPQKSQQEYYTIASLLNFAFGRIARNYKGKECLQILDRIIETFSPSEPTVLKQLNFFDSASLDISGFSNLELVLKDKQIIMRTPLKGLFVIQSSEIGRELSNYYSRENNIPCIRGTDAVKILECLRTNMEKQESMESFVKEIQQFNEKYGKMIKNNID